ncbi:MAG: GGDEF domain-containing protein [Clostridia bacterium]|nr:GGDEF domain-containing protein [Clostridia bacterium]
MITQLYIEINVICIFTLALILYKLHKAVNTRSIDKRLFALVLVCAILLYAIDIYMALIEGHALQVSKQYSAFLSAFYLTQAGVTSYAWFLLTEHRLGMRILQNRRRLFFYTLPLVALGILSLLSMRTQWLFYIDESCVYHRGRFYFIQPVLGYGYVLLAAARALYYAMREKNYIRKRGYYTLASFAILPIICGVIQTAFYGLPTLCAGITLSLLMVFITYLERQISLDPLTHLNNRNQLEKHLATKMSAVDDRHKLYVLMLDIDFFKRINDEYGHLEGDAALVRVASALKSACGTRNCFIARYGGDEFAIVYSCEDEADAAHLQQAIAETLRAANTSAQAPYALTLSIGCAQCTEAMDAIQELIAAADAKLYAAKKARHKYAR